MSEKAGRTHESGYSERSETRNQKHADQWIAMITWLHRMQRRTRQTTHNVARAAIASGEHCGPRAEATAGWSTGCVGALGGKGGGTIIEYLRIFMTPKRIISDCCSLRMICNTHVQHATCNMQHTTQDMQHTT